MARDLVITKRRYFMKGGLIISRVILSETPRDLETWYIRAPVSFAPPPRVPVIRVRVSLPLYVYAYFRNAIFREPVGRPHGSIPTHFSRALAPFGPGFFFAPLSAPRSLYLHPACLRRRSCPFFLGMATKAKPGPVNFARSPGPLRETSQRAAALWQY